MTALDTVPKLTVRRVAFAPNQARILEAEHAIKADSEEILEAGEIVSFTDVDLGPIFRGKIVDVKRNEDTGEGVTYTCADAYRSVAKSPAKKSFLGFFSTKLKIKKGTPLEDAIQQLLEPYAALFPGGIEIDIEEGTVTPEMDKGGQTLDTWLDDLLELTPGGIAYVLPNAGNPKLLVTDYYSAPAVILARGEYNIINPASGQLLLVSANQGESLNRKYKAYTAEGAGRFTRHVEKFIPSKLGFENREEGIFQFRWYLPEKAITKRYLDADGRCTDGMVMKFRVGGPNPPNFEKTIENPPHARDTDGRIFFWQMVVMGGVRVEETWPVPQVEAWFSYTSYDGPLSASAESGDPKLDGEGELIEQHCEFFQYESPELDLDGTPELQALADAAHARYGGVDVSGRVFLHIKGLNPNLKLGSAIPSYGDARVRSIEYDLVERNIVAEVSTVPLRSTVAAAKQNLAEGTVRRNNWFANRAEEGCYCNVEALLLGDGDPDLASDFSLPEGFNPVQGLAPKKGGDNDAMPWDCINCQPENVGKGGKWRTRDEALQAGCNGTLGADFIPCTGCVEVCHAGAQYGSLAACVADHPGRPDNDDDCNYNCNPNNGCAPVKAPFGVFETLAECEAACFRGPGQPGAGAEGEQGGVDDEGEGAGEGEETYEGPGNQATDRILQCPDTPENGLVKAIQVDPYGRVKNIFCGETQGLTGTFEYEEVCDSYCDESELVVLKRTITEEWVNGLLQSKTVGECSE